MTPVSFDGHAGFLHEASGDTAVVMCGATGFEHLAAHRGWRALAERFATRGFPALRFDWNGSGDSLGEESDPDRLTAWSHSLDAAIAFTRDTLAPKRIILVGLRFGATLAAEKAARLGDIDALILLAPAISGRLYGRELVGLAKVMTPKTPDVVADGVSIGGFPVSARTLDDMKALDLRKLTSRPAARALLLAPDGQMGVEEAASLWRAIGCETDSVAFDGATEWLAEPTFSRIPETTFDEIVAWTAARFEPTPATARPATPANAPLGTDQFTETPMMFGESGKLFGMLCRPTTPGHDGACAILLNAGANSHIGWARMNVEFARKLAASGIASLRIDVAGLGDSAPVAGRNPQIMYDLAPREDVGAAIDVLAGQGFSHHVLIGLCSGAHTAFHTALADARVDAAVMVNLQKFIWRDDYSLAVAVSQAYRATSAYQRGAWRLETYKRLWRGEIDARGIALELGRRMARMTAARVRDIGRLFGEGGDETSLVRRCFRTLDARGARLLLVYSADDGGLDELALHMGAGGRRLRALQGVEIAIIEGADHNLSQQAAREKLFELMAPFIRAPRARQGASAAPRPATPALAATPIV